MADRDDDKMQQAYGGYQPGLDFFRDGYATVAKGNLQSGQHSDPRMNLRLVELLQKES